MNTNFTENNIILECVCVKNYNKNCMLNWFEKGKKYKFTLTPAHLINSYGDGKTNGYKIVFNSGHTTFNGRFIFEHENGEYVLSYCKDYYFIFRKSENTNVDKTIKHCVCPKNKLPDYIPKFKIEVYGDYMAITETATNYVKTISRQNVEETFDHVVSACKALFEAPKEPLNCKFICTKIPKECLEDGSLSYGRIYNVVNGRFHDNINFDDMYLPLKDRFHSFEELKNYMATHYFEEPVEIMEVFE